MIIGVILNNFKCFKGLHYIPLTNADGTNFTGLIGLNGVGKSTVLEALDCVFNGKKLSPTIGQDIMPFKMTRIIPIFVIDGKEFQMISKLVSYQSNDKFKIISDALKDFINKEIPEDVSDTYKDVLNDMQKHWKKISISDKYLLPLYLSHGLFSVILGESQHAIILNDDYSAFSRNYINSHIYVHLSQNITEEYSFFETEQILRLLDIDLFKFLT